MPLPEWFEAINRSLSDQGTIVRESGGSIVKYTGDGLLAAFQGRGRSHLALRCGLALQKLDRTSSYRETLRIGVKLAGALEAAHAAGILHRDVKPGNILLSDYGETRGAVLRRPASCCQSASRGSIGRVFRGRTAASPAYTVSSLGRASRPSSPNWKSANSREGL